MNLLKEALHIITALYPFLMEARVAVSPYTAVLSGHRQANRPI
jgi:hypothetical protein